MYVGPSLDVFNYGRHSCCAQGLASLGMSTLVCFPPPLVGLELECDCGSCSFSFFASAFASMGA
jgi:hypothetical protein